MNNVDLQLVLPEIILLMCAILVLVAGLFVSYKRLLGLLALWGVALALFLLSKTCIAPGPAFSYILVNDALSVFFRFLSLAIAGLVILLSMAYRDLKDEDKGEYYFFILAITLSMMIAAASNNLMMIYITLEAISLMSYILAGYAKRDMFSSEAGLKYFLFGALSTGVTLYGISLVYGLFGTLDLAVISLLAETQVMSEPLLFLALLLVFVGFGFKCSLVPFHMWTPDIYQGAPTPAAAFFSVGPKAIGFVFLLRVFAHSWQPALTAHWSLIFSVLAMLTMTIGNVIALQQDNVKRLLAYSTIAQAGYILIGLAAGSFSGVQAMLFYIFIYAFMNLGAFGVVIAVSNAVRSEKIEDYAGLYQRSPFLAFMLLVSFLSLAGIPPLAGFLAKFFVFAAAVEKGLMVLVVVAALNSVVALYYYVKVIKFAFLHEPGESSPVAQPPALVLALGCVLCAVVTLGLWPHPVLNWLMSLFNV